MIVNVNYLYNWIPFIQVVDHLATFPADISLEDSDRWQGLMSTVLEELNVLQAILNVDCDLVSII